MIHRHGRAPRSAVRLSLVATLTSVCLLLDPPRQDRAQSSAPIAIADSPPTSTTPMSASPSALSATAARPPAGTTTPAPPTPHPFGIADLLAVRTFEDPRISPDGAWVAYTVTANDLKADRRNADIWMTSWDGTRTLQLTRGDKNEQAPRFSLDGRWLSFLSSRDYEQETDQLWLMDRAGGEAERVTDLPGGIQDYAWSPDGSRLALIVSDPDPDAARTKGSGEPDSSKTARPIVLDRFWFKDDDTGYLRNLHAHLNLFDVASRKVDPLSTGSFDDALPAWSPDGRRIAFVSKRAGDPDRHSNFDVYVIEAKPGAPAHPLTSFEGADCEPDWESPPAWSPDGTQIAYLQGGLDKLIYYAVRDLAVIPVVPLEASAGSTAADVGATAAASAAAGPARVLTADLDRNVSRPRWTADGKSIECVFEDDRQEQLVRVRVKDGALTRLISGPRTVSAFARGPKGQLAVLAGGCDRPAEICAADPGLRTLSHQNDAVLHVAQRGSAREIECTSPDGTVIHGLLLTPPGYQAGTRLPTILWLHGGPVSQFAYDWRAEPQIFAAAGYAVVLANPRGSSGRGEDYSRAIFADWGNQDAQDVLAAVDAAVSLGIADPQRLGVGGWSYGGMLTNNVIAQDHRFKAACSGASISNALAGYGTDMYVREYEQELGRPWEQPQAYARVSAPFLHADRITTPTLFLCGQIDFNVPLLNSEQMYQAVRSLGVTTELVIYPGQHHALRKPSYLRDRLERYLAWYARFVKSEAGARAAQAQLSPRSQK